MHWVVPVVLLLVSILTLIIGVILYDKTSYGLIDKKDCDDPTKWQKTCGQEKECCTVWDDDICNKGKMKDKKCVSSTKTVTKVLIVTGSLLFVSAIVTFILVMISRNRKQG